MMNLHIATAKCRHILITDFVLFYFEFTVLFILLLHLYFVHFIFNNVFFFWTLIEFNLCVWLHYFADTLHEVGFKTSICCFVVMPETV